MTGNMLKFVKFKPSWKRFLIPRRWSNRHTSDACWGALAIEPPILGWWAKLRVQHTCCLCDSHELLTKRSKGTGQIHVWGSEIVFMRVRAWRTSTYHPWYHQAPTFTFKSIHTNAFSVACFSATILFARVHEKICLNFMWQIHLMKNWRANFYVGKKKYHMESLFVCTIRHRKFATYSEVGIGFFGFVSTIYCYFWGMGKRVFNIAFAVLMHEQISLLQKTCHRKFARLD